MNESQDIRFYCGVGEKNFNHHPVHTGLYACVSPVSGRGGKDANGKPRKQKRNSVFIPAEAREVFVDSGAYSDTTYHRCTFEEALERQLAHARDFGYMEQVSHFADYDVLIDEQDRGDGVRVKERWQVDVADYAVGQTVLAAQYLDGKRDDINQAVGHPTGLILSAQGVDSAQYLRCAERVLPYLRESDVFGLGGWCILGVRRSLLPTFFETMNELIPLCKKQGVKRVHIWGVCYAQALGPLLFLCDHKKVNGIWVKDHDTRIELSTDSVGPTTRVVKELVKDPGYAMWGYASWCKKVPLAKVQESCKHLNERGEKAPACTPETYCRGNERTHHVDATIDWLAHFSEREPHLYHAPACETPLPIQSPLFEVAS